MWYEIAYNDTALTKISLFFLYFIPILLLSYLFEPSRTKFYGPNEPKYGPIKALNLHRDPKGNQRWTKQPEREKIRLNFRLSTSTVEHKRSPIF